MEDDVEEEVDIMEEYMEEEEEDIIIMSGVVLSGVYSLRRPASCSSSLS